VTCDDALQASTAVPFDEMAKSRLSIERPSIMISNQAQQLHHETMVKKIPARATGTF
jgi:hypothetical protein